MSNWSEVKWLWYFTIYEYTFLIWRMDLILIQPVNTEQNNASIKFPFELHKWKKLSLQIRSENCQPIPLGGEILSSKTLACLFLWVYLPYFWTGRP